MWLLWVLLGFFLISAMSGGLALGMHLLFPHLAERRRIIWSAGIAAFLPMSLAFGGFFSDAQVADEDFFLGMVALMLLSVIIFSVCCLPPAWWTTVRLGRRRELAPRLDTEAPELIEG